MINSYISYFLIILELTSLKNLIILISDLSKNCVHVAMQLFYLQVHMLKNHIFYNTRFLRNLLLEIIFELLKSQKLAISRFR